MVSESEFTVQGHGVHTAFKELSEALQQRNDTKLSINASNAAVDITHIQTIGLYSVWKLVTGKSKKVVSAHVIPASFIGSIVGAKYWEPLARFYMKWFYSRADVVLAVSNSVADVLVNEMKLTNRVEVLYNSVDMSSYAGSPNDRQEARQKLRFSEKEKIVLGNGQVQPRKRLDTFFEVAEALPDVTFVWIGGVPFKKLGADSTKMVHMMEHAPKNVRMVGIIDHKDVTAYLSAADIFFLPAEQENHPMCVLEAAGAGLPILLRDIREYDDTFRPDALLFTTTEDAAKALSSLLSEEPLYQAQKKATLRIAERFDATSGAHQVMEIYRSLLPL